MKPSANTDLGAREIATAARGWDRNCGKLTQLANTHDTLQDMEKLWPDIISHGCNCKVGQLLPPLAGSQPVHLLWVKYFLSHKETWDTYSSFAKKILLL